MKLSELKQFLGDCIKKEIAFPKNMMTVVVDDFHDVVSAEHRQSKELEFSHRIGNEFAKVKIIPKI